MTTVKLKGLGGPTGQPSVQDVTETIGYEFSAPGVPSRIRWTVESPAVAVDAGMLIGPINTTAYALVSGLVSGVLYHIRCVIQTTDGQVHEGMLLVRGVNQ